MAHLLLPEPDFSWGVKVVALPLTGFASSMGSSLTLTSSSTSITTHRDGATPEGARPTLTSHRERGSSGSLLWVNNNVLSDLSPLYTATSNVSNLIAICQLEYQGVYVHVCVHLGSRPPCYPHKLTYAFSWHPNTVSTCPREPDLCLLLLVVP